MRGCVSQIKGMCEDGYGLWFTGYGSWITGHSPHLFRQLVGW